MQILHLIADNNDEGIRLDAFLAQKSGETRSRIQNLIKDGCVRRNGKAPGKAGEKLTAGATVYLTISQGAKTETVIMPYLVGKDYATAEAELAAARLTLVSVSYVYNNTIPVDYVVSQTVEAGTEIPAYSKIYLQISLGPETTPTPSPSPVPTQDPNAE